MLASPGHVAFRLPKGQERVTVVRPGVGCLSSFNRKAGRHAIIFFFFLVLVVVVEFEMFLSKDSSLNTGSLNRAKAMY